MTKRISGNLRRFFALLLCVAMLLPMLPLQLTVRATEASPEATLQTTSETEDLTIVLQQVRDLYNGGVKSDMLVYDGGNTVSGGGEKSYMTIIRGTTADYFVAYQAALKAAGYTVYSENTVDSKTANNPNRFGSYRSPGGKYKVYTYYLYAYGETRIIVDTQVDTVSGFNYVPQTGKTVEPKLVMWGLSMSTMGYDIGEVMSTDQEKQRNCGAMFVIRMTDNTLFIHDGGDMRQWSDEACDEFLAFCRELTGTTGTDEKMVINTWFISHAHRDHFQGFYRFLAKYHDQFDMKYVMYNIDEERTDVDVDISGAMKLVRRCYPDAKYYKPHTGEKLSIAGVTLDVLYTQEDRYYPDADGKLITDVDFKDGTYRDYLYKNATTKTSNFNDTTTVIRATFENGVDSILYGDLALARQWMLDCYHADVLKTDIMSVPHHGFDDQKELVAAAEAEIYLYNQSKSAIYGADDDVTTVEMYGTYHKTLWDNYLKIFPDMNVSKDTVPSVDYEIYWAGNNTVTLDINTLGQVLNGTSTEQYCDQTPTVDVEYTGWGVEDLSSDVKDHSDRLLSMSGSAQTVDTIVNGTFAFRFNPVKNDVRTTNTAASAQDDGQLVNYGIYAVMHKATGTIMAYDSVALDPGRPNRATSLHQVSEADAPSAGMDVFYIYSNRVYTDHSNLDRISWIIRQDSMNVGDAFAVKTTETNNGKNWITDPQFGEAAHSYAHTWLYKGLFRETNTLHYWETSTISSQKVNWWYAQSGHDADSPVTQYRYLNLRYDDKGWVTNKALDEKYSDTDRRGYQIEYLGQDSEGIGEFIIFWYDATGDDARDNKTYCFLTCDENGNWGVKKYTSRTAAKADMENLKLRLYQYETWRRTDNEKTIRYSMDHTVFNVEAGTSVEQLLSLIHEKGNLMVQNGENRDYLQVPFSGTEPKVGYYYLEFDKPYDASASGTNQYTLSLMYCDEATTDTKLTQVTVNVYDRKLEFSGETVYRVTKWIAQSDLSAQIAQSITVTQTFSNIRGNLAAPAEVSFSEIPEAGKYWLDFDYTANGSNAYLAHVNYRRTDGTDILVKTLSVYATEVIESFLEPESKLGLVLLNSELGAVVLDENGKNITFRINETDINVSVGMLTVGDNTTRDGETVTGKGLPVNTAAEGTYEGLVLTYDSQVICENFTLRIVRGDESLNYPAKGQPGYVGTNKIGTTTEAEFSKNGVANIQLSTNGLPAERGVDLIVIMDLSGSMLNRLDTNSVSEDYQATRVVAMENSLKEMIKTLQTSGADVRIAMSDFGDLDNFELEGVAVDSSIAGKNMFDMDFDNNQYAESFEFSNHLNFIMKEPKKDSESGIYHNPYGIYLKKHDNAYPDAAQGMYRPTVYTGSGKVEADAFVDVDSLYDGTKFTADMKGIINQLDENVQKAIGTNYDVGLEFAYNLGYAIRQDNISKGNDREIICVFMSDGGPMQFNYFTGTTKTDAWTDWITGRIESIGSNGYSATNLPDGVEALKANLLKMLKAGNLVRPEYQRGPWYENYCYQLGTDGKYTGSSSNTIKDASKGYFVYRERYQSSLSKSTTFFDYMNNLAYDLDWDFLCRIAWANGIEEFDEEYYRNNPVLPELIDLLLDMEFIGYEHAGNQVYHKVYRTKLKDPGMSEQQYYTQYTGSATDFTQAMTELGVDCTWDLLGKIAYKNRASLSDFWTYMGVVPENNSMDKKRVAGAKALELIADQLRTVPEGYSHGTVSPYTYFYNAEGNNWWAEAIKGDTDKLYPVINRFAYENNPYQPYAYYGDIREDYNGQKYMSAYRGLGIDIYSISFSMADDNKIKLGDMELIMQRISSDNGVTNNYSFTANSQDELTDALLSVVSNMSSDATDAYYTDTMGADYDLYYEQVEGVTKEATIKVMEYSLDADGNRTGEPIAVRETITFAKVGSTYEAYSDQISGGSTNIWDTASGLIRGKYVIYNANTDTSATVQLGDGSNLELLPETFYWSIGNIGQTDLVLEYQVYLVGSMENILDTEGKKIYYPTNLDATLSYVNYLGNQCTQSPVSPRYPWITVMENSMNLDKTVENGNEADEFTLTLEAYATGKTVKLPVTKPADVVLVLDQSASMYTPRGAEDYRYDRWYSQNANTNLQKISTDQLSTEKGSHLGYYIAQSKERNRQVNEGSNDYNGNGSTGELLNIYDWFVVQYVNGIGWVYVRVADTTTPVSVDTAGRAAYVANSGSQYYMTLVNPEGSGKVITGFNYYQSQYGALYESVNNFVSGLAAAGQKDNVEHRVAITGFSSPYYDGITDYDGSGVYINGSYYLYDTDYQYMGYTSSASPSGYMLYVTDEMYASMAGDLPAALEGITWSRTLPSGANLVRLDPNQSNSGTTITAGGRTFTAGQYFYPVAASGEQLSYNAMTDALYGQALMNVGSGAVSAEVTASIEAIRTNYQQTCPAAGLDMAQKIIAANASADRDQIVILFTDGVPTVPLDANRGYAEHGDAGVSEAHWSGIAGAKDAINLANTMKSQGIQIYTIGTSGLTASVPVHPSNKADGASVTTISGQSFLNYVSSNLQGITAEHTVTTRTGDNTVLASSQLSLYQNGQLLSPSNPAVTSGSSYAKSSADGDVGVAFGEIMEEVSAPSVTLGQDAQLKEILSQYFCLANLENLESNISVYTTACLGMDKNGNYLFSDKLVPYDSAVVEITQGADGRYDTISVSNFDYSNEYVSVFNNQPRGRKLVVKVSVKAREGFWGGNNVPTNDPDTAIYTGSGDPFLYFPQPQVNVPVKPVIEAGEKTVYYGGNVDALELVDRITLGGVDVNISDTGVLTPRESWMDDFATLTWTPELTGPESPISGKDANTYDYGVTLTPIDNGKTNTSALPSNMAGAPVERIASDPDTAEVFVLEPVITWKDMVIDLGTMVDAGFCDENDLVSLSWVDQDTRETPQTLPEDAPVLTYSYSYEGKPLQDVPMDVHVISSYNGEDITHVVTYLWEGCNQPVHKINRDQILEHKGSDISYEFYIHVNGGDALVSDKKAETIEGKTDEFILNMEGYVTGSIEHITVTKPADIVLVLDHSASMYTPVGAPDILHSPVEGGYPGEIYTGEGSMTRASLDKDKGAHRGYYVAQSTTSKAWFLMEYNATTDKWIGYSIPSTEAIVDPTPGNYTEHTKTQSWTYAGLPSQLVYYKTQYGVLYDSVLNFVEDLRASGVEHCVSIVGFAGSETSGTRIYVGGDETDIKTYSALYHVNTSAARRNELFRKAMKNVQDDAQYSQLLSNIEAIETNSSFTCPSAGIHLANELYNANEMDRDGRDRIMILFTDGIPNRAMGEDENGGKTQAQIYDEIVKEAAAAKIDYGTTIYSVSTTTLGAGADRTFLSYASSDYPNATGYTTPGSPINGGSKYTMQVNGIDDMGIVFDTVTQAVGGTEVKLDSTAVLTDIITKYFELVGDTTDVKVYTQRYLGNDQWAEEVPFKDAVVTLSASASGRLDTISVTGFDYGKEYISNDARTQTYIDADGNPVTTENYRGSKLVVKVHVKTRDGFWGGNNIPTNENTAGIFGSGDVELSKFPEPQVNVPVKPLITAKDQTVYYGEDGLDATDHLVDKITVDGKEVTYDKQSGTFTPAEDWMDDFADMSWDPNGTTPTTPISGTDPDDYTFCVILKPKTDGTTNTIPENGGNVAGTPVNENDGIVSDEAVGSVDVLVPVIKFEDSTLILGDKTSKDYYENTNRDPIVNWVNKEDPYSDKGLTAEPSTGFDQEPTLDFSYSSDGRFMEDTPVDVTVSMGDTNITDEVYFDWVDCDSELHDDDETIADDKTGDTLHRHQGSTDSFEFYVHVTSPLKADTVVIDFGIPVDINATFNDILPSGATLTGVALGAEGVVLYDTKPDGTIGADAQSGFGTLTKNADGTLRYVLTKETGMKLDCSDVFRYEVSYQAIVDGITETRYYQSTVTVIPATIIYYEDNFLTFSTEVKQEDGTYQAVEGGWTIAGQTQTGTQQQDRPGAVAEALKDIDADNIYGTDSAYKTMNEFSMGSAAMVKVRDGLAGVVNFSFKGTGFDLISLSSDDTGVVMVSITDKDGKTVANYMVDSYYGYALNYYKLTYTYTETGWTKTSEAITRDQMGESQICPENPKQGDTFVVYQSRFEPNTNASATLYQVPVIKVDLNQVAIKDDPNTAEVESGFYGYGEYNVEIYVGYSWLFDHSQCECTDGCTGCFDFYVDAVRIYDQANNGADDKTVEDAYKEDNEYLPTYQELRDHLIDKGTFSTLTDEAPGVIFIDSNPGLTDDNASGVSGQIMDGQSAIADYANYGPNNELYLTAGQAVAFRLDSPANINKLHLALKSVGGSAEATVYGIRDGKTTYVLNKATIDTATDLYYDISDLIGATVIIRNSGTAGMLSITNLKTTYLSNTANGKLLFSISPSIAQLALSSINEGTPAPILPDGEDCINLQYASVTFEDELKLNIYFDLKDLEAQELGLITFTEEVENGDLTNADAVIPGASFNGTSYIATTEGIAAKNLVDQVWFRVYAKLEDGTVLYSKLRSYSPAQYAHTVFGGENYSAGLKALTASMLIYGAEAQKLFGYRTDELLTTGFTAQELALAGTYSSDLFAGIQAADAAKVGTFAATEGAFSRKYPNVGFGSAFTIGYFMTPGKTVNAAPVLYYWTQEAYDAADTLTAENASGVLTMTGSGEYKATVTGIAPKDMNSTIYAAAVYQSNGETCCSGVMAYSLGAYFQTNAAVPGAMQSLAKAAAVYGSLAEVYFN